MQPEETLSIPDHGRTWVGNIEQEGRPYAKFVYDLAGRLIYREEPPKEGAFGQGARWLAFRNEAPVPQPWHWSRTEFLRDLGHWLEEAPNGIREMMRELYPEGAPGVVDGLFIPEAEPAGRKWSPEQLCRVLDAAEHQQASETRAWQAMQRLYGLGVVQLPTIEHFDERYHEALEGEPSPGDRVAEVAPAYGFDRRVLRRARVKLEIR